MDSGCRVTGQVPTVTTLEREIDHSSKIAQFRYADQRKSIERAKVIDRESNAGRFLHAFASIEKVLSEQQNQRIKEGDWAAFGLLVDGADQLRHSQKVTLKRLARLRNSISHAPYLENKPIADPREDAVEEILKLQQFLEKPPLLLAALHAYQAPQILEGDDPLEKFLELVKRYEYSQAPVKTSRGYELVTTNSVSRWVAHNLSKQDGFVDAARLSEVLDFNEPGDRLVQVSPTTTVIDAINYFSGQANREVEPPAALLLLGGVNRPPQRLVARADLSRLYKFLGF